jgi:hypothetical protein
LDLNRTALEKEGEGGAHRLGFRRVIGETSALEVDDSGALVVLDGDGDQDEVQVSEAKTMASSSCSIASSHVTEGRPEMDAMSVSFRRGWTR